MSIYLCKLQTPLWCSLSAQELLFKPPFIAFVCFICCTFHLPKDDLCYQGHRVNTREDIYMSIYRSSLIVRMTIWATASCMLTPPPPPPPPPLPAPPPPPPPLLPLRHGHKSLMKIGSFPCNHRAGIIVMINCGGLQPVYLQW